MTGVLGNEMTHGLSAAVYGSYSNCMPFEAGEWKQDRVCSNADSVSIACLRMGMRDSQAKEKGIWWMPWHREAMKDVAPCEKLRGEGSTL